MLTHGGLDEAELRGLGLSAGEVLDFSANINPLGMSPQVRDAIKDVDLASYPDRNSTALREALANRLHIGVDELLISNGSTELIHLVARAQLQPGGACLIFKPTFGEYEAAAMIAGADVHSIHAEESDGFRWSMDDAVREIERVRPQIVFLCNPNNPTGVYLDPGEVGRIGEAVGSDGLLVLDDAFASLADSEWDALSLLTHGNVAVLRSMTKDHGLAGIRLGYMVASPKIVSEARRLQPSWSVNAIAQAAGLAALDDDEHVNAAREVIARSREVLTQGLRALGVSVLPSATNFVMAKVGNGADVRAALLSRRIVVRDCASFGLPEYIRIAVRKEDECSRLIAALQEVLEHE